MSDSSSMWVRTAAKKDLVIIQGLLAETWHATYDNIYGRDRVSEITRDWHSLDALEKQLNAPKSEFLVADDGNIIAGMAYGRQISDSEVKLAQLYVLPEFQGRGVGALLLDEIEQSFFEVPTISLEVEEKNTGALAFYSKRGFIQTGSTDNCGKNDSAIAAIIMSKNRAA